MTVNRCCCWCAIKSLTGSEHFLAGIQSTKDGEMHPQSFEWGTPTALFPNAPKLSDNTGHVGHVSLFPMLDLPFGTKFAVLYIQKRHLDS